VTVRRTRPSAFEGTIVRNAVTGAAGHLGRLVIDALR
jgi:hypothetical protein